MPRQSQYPSYALTRDTVELIKKFHQEKDETIRHQQRVQIKDQIAYQLSRRDASPIVFPALPLTNLDFSGLDLSNSDFSETEEMSYMNLSECLLVNTSFESGSRIKRKALEGTNFSNSTCSRADFSYAD